MLQVGDKLAKVNKLTNEVFDIFRIEGSNNGLNPFQSILYCTSIDGKTSLSLPFPKYTDDWFLFEPLTKDHEQRYQNFLHKQTINEWFDNKEFSFEEKEAIFNSFNVVLATERDRKVFFETIENEREPNEAMVKAFNNRNKFFTND